MENHLKSTLELILARHWTEKGFFIIMKPDELKDQESEGSMEIKADFYKSLIEDLDVGVYIVDTERRITFWNKGAEKITGFHSSEVTDRFCHSDILNHVTDHGEKLCFGGCPLHKSILDGTIGGGLVYLHHKEGHRVPVSVKTVPIVEDGKIIGGVEIFYDESERKELMKNMETYKELAMKDQLTGLSNRRHVEVYLESRLYELRQLGIPFGILFVDIDHFKKVNDTYGHDVGDQVLIMTARTCESLTRITDLMGRLGGEEFIVIFSGVQPELLQEKAQQMRILVESSSLRYQGQSLGVTVSMGVTMAKQEDTIQTLLKRGDELLYKSKTEGRNRISFE